jgi:hypothetical protein
VQDTRPRYPNTNTPEDKYLRPFNDSLNPFQYITFDYRASQERFARHSELNHRETVGAINFLVVWVVALPLMLGFLVSRGVANPIMSHIQETQPESFPLTKRARKQGVEALRRETYRVQFDASVGRAPPLSEGELHVCPTSLLSHFEPCATQLNPRASPSCSACLMHVLCDTIPSSPRTICT